MRDTTSLNSVIPGENGVLSGLVPGATLIDMGTSSISETRRLASMVEKLGGRYIDAPVSGGELGAKAGTLSIMVGGAQSNIERAKPIFDILGSSLTRIGPVGTGQVAKAANQAIVGATIGAVAESLALAEAAGADLDRVREALSDGFADSRILDLHGRRMIDGKFTPGERATTRLKDMRQSVVLAKEVGISLPILGHVCDLWAEMVACGYGDLDHSGYFKFTQSGRRRTS